MFFGFIDLIFFVLGLVIGSFLNVVIYRLETEHSIWRGRSFCPHCKHALSAIELVPLASFLWQRGRCRHCRQPISAQYPLVEIATGIVFVLVFRFLSLSAVVDFFSFSFLIHYGYWMFVSAILIAVFVYDLKYMLIPDGLIYLGMAAVFLSKLIFSFKSVCYFSFNCPMPDALLGAIAGSGLFLFLVLVSREKWMGWGDVKLGFLLGLVLGAPKILIALMSAFLLGSIIGVSLIVAGRKGLKSQVPFGPFLIIGFYVALFFGQYLLDKYLALFYGF